MFMGGKISRLDAVLIRADIDSKEKPRSGTKSRSNKLYSDPTPKKNSGFKFDLIKSQTIFILSYFLLTKKNKMLI